MEFEFRKDFISGLTTVQTEMNHEAFATWLEMEGQSINWVELLIKNLDLLQSGALREYKLAGREFDLLLTDAEAQVTNHRLMEEDDQEPLIDDLSFYNAEVEASCGLEDFKCLIESWLNFIS